MGAYQGLLGVLRVIGTQPPQAPKGVVLAVKGVIFVFPKYHGGIHFGIFSRAPLVHTWALAGKGGLRPRP